MCWVRANGVAKVVTELIFEGYNAPSLTYGIDALFSFNYNGGNSGLVVSSGNTTTHLIPVLDRKGLIPLTTRLSWGGSQGSDFMLKLLQLKYSGFPSKLASWQAEALMADHCYVSGDYKEELGGYLQPTFLEEKDRVVQFPFTETVKIEKSQEELDKIAEKRKESGRRLQEQAAKARLEKARTHMRIAAAGKGWRVANDVLYIAYQERTRTGVLQRPPVKSGNDGQA